MNPRLLILLALISGGCLDSSPLGRVELQLAVDESDCEAFCIENLHIALYFVDQTGVPAFQTIPCGGDQVVFESVMAGAQVYAVVQAHRLDGMSLMGQSNQVTVPAFSAAELEVELAPVDGFVPLVSDAVLSEGGVLTVSGEGFGDPTSGITRLEVNEEVSETTYWSDFEVEASDVPSTTPLSVVVRNCGIASEPFTLSETR
jgi:hypothetical protein